MVYFCVIKQNRESTEGYSKSIARKNNDKFGKRIGYFFQYSCIFNVTYFDTFMIIKYVLNAQGSTICSQITRLIANFSDKQKQFSIAITFPRRMFILLNVC